MDQDQSKTDEETDVDKDVTTALIDGMQSIEAQSDEIVGNIPCFDKKAARLYAAYRTMLESHKRILNSSDANKENSSGIGFVFECFLRMERVCKLRKLAQIGTLAIRNSACLIITRYYKC